jgi:UDP-N-acetylglucosamine:LPS N-acetylglucosamine transferase
MKKKILVLTDTMPWGHRAIARAIFSGLKSHEKEDNWEVKYAELKAETGIGNDLYKFIYRFTPRLGKFAYRLASSRRAVEMFEKLAWYNLKNLERTISRQKPDLIISCYFLHSHSLALWKERDDKNYLLWTVVADPWTSNELSFVKGVDMHLVYDEVEEKVGMKLGVEKKRILKTGWWVRPEMYKKYDKEQSRKKLGFYDDRPIVFVGGGSLGTNSLARVLPATMLIKKKVGLIFNTGTDKLAYNMVEEYVRIFRNLRDNGLVQIKNVGWIDNMAEVLSACDLVMGKAGPNFLFDVIATEKPFVAITHISGQEDGNIELIKKKKIGWVKEKPSEAADFLLDYLDDPKKYEAKYRDNVKKEARTNKMSLEVIRREIKRL